LTEADTLRSIRTCRDGDGEIGFDERFAASGHDGIMRAAHMNHLHMRQTIIYCVMLKSSTWRGHIPPPMRSRAQAAQHQGTVCNRFNINFSASVQEWIETDSRTSERKGVLLRQPSLVFLTPQ